MKTLASNLEQFLATYSHPSIALFRAIELKTIHETCKNKIFLQPSLDLGCGDGKIAKMLFDDQFTYGIDNGEAKDVKEAVKDKIYGKVLLESAEKMSLLDNSVNFVFSNCVIEHIPGIENVLSEVSRILKSCGFFVFTTPSDKFSDYLYISNKLSSVGLGFLEKKYIKKRNAMLNHYNMHSREGWQEKLKEYRMEVVDHAYYISKDALMLWDKMALEIFLKNKLLKNQKMRVSMKYREAIKKAYESPNKQGEDGGAILIVARKI